MKSSKAAEFRAPVPALQKLPRHIAVIMDGNGRWAQERKLPRIMGHRAGVKAVRELVKSCGELGIAYLTLYAFSQENWKRPRREVDLLMELLNHFMDEESSTIIKERIRFLVIGRIEALPEHIQKKIADLTRRTEGFDRLNLIIALNYGARREIVDAAKNLMKDIVKRGGDASSLEAGIDSIDEETFSRYLYTAGIPDPDMLIRTSGELRLSNFLLWQCSYSEIWISKKYWPDFGREDLLEAVRDFGERERRFGAVR